MSSCIARIRGLCLVALPVAASFHAYSEPSNAQICFEALTAAARDEYRIRDTTESQREFHDAFCDAVHAVQRQKDEGGLSALAKQLTVSLSGSRETMSDLDRTYCRATADLAKFYRDTNVALSLVHGDPLNRFNECMALAAGAPQGFAVKTTSVDQCRFVAAIRYNRYSVDNSPSARVGRSEVFNATCGKMPSQFDATERLVSCRRSRWMPAYLFIPTSQGIVLVKDGSDIQPPPRPELNPPIPRTDAKTTSFRVTKDAAGGGGMRDGDSRNASGSFSIPEAGAVITSVAYTCSGGTTTTGDQFCHYSYHRRPERGREGDVEFSPNSRTFTWYRRWTMPANVDEDYLVSYTVPHARTDEETRRWQAYQREMHQYETALASGPCGPASSGGAAAKPLKAGPGVQQCCCGGGMGCSGSGLPKCPWCS